MNPGKINFNAGPASLPPEVKQEFAEAVKEYGNTDVSVLELQHRGTDFLEIVEECNALVRELCGIGQDYEVLWLHGGGRIQFAMIPMNFLSPGDSAGYIDSGYWAAEAMEYGAYYGKVDVLASSRSSGYNRLPEWPAEISEHLKYLHITTNNTIYGTQYHSVPLVKVPLVADMSSDIYSCARNYNQYDMFYAAVQKNLGTPGVALAVIKRSMLDRITNALPPVLDYRAQVKEKSILNTANVSGIYMALLMLRWTKAKGIANIEAANERKAAMLYELLDRSSLFTPYVVEKSHRSKMNVCFTIQDAEKEAAFLQLCNNNNIVGVKGHRSTGGFRVSIYNAVTEPEVKTLVDLMQHFEAKA